MPAANINEDAPAAPVASPAPAKVQYAIKTSLALTLAYLIPMAMGWPQPQTAATTVMLIAATGLVSDSLQKGVLRVLGTVIGAIVGLSLIALFPQERMAYLLGASLAVSIFVYLYNAFQGDGTIFMLSSVVTLMVFNGGDAEGAFLYGVDRAFMTAFGVAVYTLVASALWPVRAADNTRALAAAAASGYRQAFERLAGAPPDTDETLEQQLARLLADAEAFQTQFASVRNSADGVSDYLPEWHTIIACHEDIQARLVAALEQDLPVDTDPATFMENHPDVTAHIGKLFHQVEQAWQGRESPAEPGVITPIYRGEALGEAGHLAVATVVARAEMLEHLQQDLIDLLGSMRSLLFDGPRPEAQRNPRGTPSFVWLDAEAIKTGARAFITFWIATTIWILFNPPGGFVFVTMCTILIPLVSYTPVTPKLLFILLTLGFIFAVPAYVFLLPNMTHWLELGAFLFAYGFLGFFVFQGPVSIFFLLGLFTLGIQNEMSYQFDGLLLTMLMFYMVCATLIISTHFPFSSKPEKVYAGLRRRFFRHCERLLVAERSDKLRNRWVLADSMNNGPALLAKMKLWGAKVDPVAFPDSSQQQIAAFNRSCELLLGELQILVSRRDMFRQNTLIAKGEIEVRANPLARLCTALANNAPDAAFDEVHGKLVGIEAKLDELLGDDYLERYSRQDLGQFYSYLSLQRSILRSLDSCREAQRALDWGQLRETSF